MERKAQWIGIAAAAVAVVACGGGSGSAGTRVLARSTLEAAGTNCSSGGHRLEFGPDTNGSGQLEDSEVQGSAYTCTENIASGDARCPAGGSMLQIAGLASGPAPSLVVCNGTVAQANTVGVFAAQQQVDGRWSFTCNTGAGTLTCGNPIAPLMPSLGGMRILNDPALLTKLCRSIGASGLASSTSLATTGAHLTWNGSTWAIRDIGAFISADSFTCSA
jgi:hypothetical protein